jgi:hypothetical protein
MIVQRMIEGIMAVMAPGLLVACTGQMVSAWFIGRFRSLAGNTASKAAPGPKWIGLALLAACWIPVGGHPLGRQMVAFTAPLSIPLVLMASIQICLPPTRQSHCWTLNFWSVNALLGLVLFPAACGLGGVDPYTWGWHPHFFWLPLGLTSWFAFRGNWMLSGCYLLTTAAWKLQLCGTANGWNYLIDPISFVISLAGLIQWAIQRRNTRFDLPESGPVIESVIPEAIPRRTAA